MQFSQQQAQARAEGKAGYDEGLRKHMLGIYNYMAIALTITGLVALFTARTPALLNFIYNSGGVLPYLIMFSPLIFGFLIFPLARKSNSIPVMQGTFWAYAVVMGLSMSTIVLQLSTGDLARVFFITASVFGSMSLYGYTTKRDLSGIRTFLIMGLIGLILASVVNLFLGSTQLQFAVSVIGVLVFIGFTAYDTQSLKQIYYHYTNRGGDNQHALAIARVFGALKLYIDFVVLFYYIASFFMNRR